MSKTGYLYDERFQLHDTGSYHPECPERLKAIHRGIVEGGLLPRLVRLQARPAEVKWIEAVHPLRYIQRLQSACLHGKQMFDCPDNLMCTATYDIALLAVGGILDAVRRVMDGALNNAFCAVRPPGHHAEVDQAMGFCYFNNIAIAARYLQREWGIRKVGIIDFDVHHGNGTQHIFEDDPSVFYYSIHQHPSFAYPGTGREFETGSVAGYGFTKNSPVLPGEGDAVYRTYLERDMVPAMARFEPEVLLVSTGFDAHAEDEMSDIRLSTESFSWIMEQVKTLAEAHCRGRLISILEGGYALKRLPELACNHVRILLDS